MTLLAKNDILSIMQIELFTGRPSEKNIISRVVELQPFVGVQTNIDTHG